MSAAASASSAPPPASSAAAERRDLARAPANLRGKVFPGGLDCIIRDLHRRGARLVFDGPPPAPQACGDEMVLVIWSTGVAIEALGRWRGGVDAGVQFQRRFDLRGRVPERLLAIKAQWQDRRRRLRRSELKDCAAMVGYRGAPSAVQLS